MNKEKQQRNKREILNQIRQTNLSGNRSNCFISYMSETDEHIKKKFEVWLKLRRADYEVWSEVIFKTGIRMDLLAFKEGFWTNYEILHNESIKQLSEKVKKYPNMNIIPVKTNEDITNLEML